MHSDERTAPISKIQFTVQIVNWSINNIVNALLENIKIY